MSLRPLGQAGAPLTRNVTEVRCERRHSGAPTPLAARLPIAPRSALGLLEVLIPQKGGPHRTLTKLGSPRPAGGSATPPRSTTTRALALVLRARADASSEEVSGTRTRCGVVQRAEIDAGRGRHRVSSRGSSTRDCRGDRVHRQVHGSVRGRADLRGAARAGLWDRPVASLRVVTRQRAGRHRRESCMTRSCLHISGGCTATGRSDAACTAPARSGMNVARSRPAVSIPNSARCRAVRSSSTCAINGLRGVRRDTALSVPRTNSPMSVRSRRSAWSVIRSTTRWPRGTRRTVAQCR